MRTKVALMTLFLVIAAGAVVVFIWQPWDKGPDLSQFVGVWRNVAGWKGRPIKYQVWRRELSVTVGMYHRRYHLKAIERKGKTAIITVIDVNTRREVRYRLEIVGPDTVILQLSKEHVKLKRDKGSP